MIHTHKTVSVKTKRGFTLKAFEHDAITKEIQQKGEYEANTLNSLSDILSTIQPRTSLDIGANIGNHALIIALHSANLIAFEPIDFIYKTLQENLIINNIQHANAVNAGLSDQEASPNIFVALNGNLGSSSLEASEVASEPTQIKIIRGDDYIQNNHIQDIDFIKMDIEGHEASALLGLENTIEAYQPLILLEWNNKNTKDNFEKLDLFNRIFSGYVVYSLSYTYNKKIHTKSLSGFLKRLYFKIWGCLR